MTNMKFRHVVWDWNGTLLNDSNACWRVCNGIFKEFNRPEIDLHLYRHSITIPARVFWNAHGLGASDEEYLLISERFHQLYHIELEECRLHDGIADLVSDLSNGGVTQSILSAHQEALLHYATKQFNLFSKMTDVVGVPDHTAGGKIGVGLDWINRSGVDRQQTIMVGDMQHDFEVAQALGIGCVLISHGFQAPGVLEQTGADIVHSLDELAGYLGAR